MPPHPKPVPLLISLRTARGTLLIGLPIAQPVLVALDRLLYRPGHPLHLRDPSVLGQAFANHPEAFAQLRLMLSPAGMGNGASRLSPVP